MKNIIIICVFAVIFITIGAYELQCDVQYKLTMITSEVKYVWSMEIEGDMIKVMPKRGTAYYIPSNTVSRIDFIGCKKLSEI